MLTGRFVALPEDVKDDPARFMSKFVARAGEPVVRTAAMQAMRILGEQFVLGRNIESALKRGASMQRAGLASCFSFDMLGEGARTDADAEKYLASYANAIEAVGADAGVAEVRMPSSISVKLSALHPRYEARQEERVFAELYPRMLQLCEQAKSQGIA